MNVERFLIQVKQNLPEHDGVTTWVENSALNVGYGKSESFEIRYPRGICYNAATEKTNEFYKLVEEADKAFKTVKEYIDLMDKAPELSARDFNMPYKLLAEFNGVVLGGIEHRSNNTFEFTTWSYANNSLYRFDSQERALMGGMRGVAFSALLGLSDFRKDALATALHVYYLQRKYPHAEMSLSCPRLRPIINNDKINPLDVHEKQLCQIICAYRIFLPYVGITVSSRESESFRNGIVKIAATKVSAGVSTGIGDHESKYTGKESEAAGGDEQFEIDDSRSLEKMYKDIEDEGLQPVLNDYLYV